MTCCKMALLVYIADADKSVGALRSYFWYDLPHLSIHSVGILSSIDNLQGVDEAGSLHCCRYIQ
jgi:hypothetical protein